MWELATAMVKDKVNVETYLKEGYEPFAITQDREERIWLKRKVKNEVYISKSRKPKRKSSRESTVDPEE